MRSIPPLYYTANKWILKNSYSMHQMFILIFTFICYSAFHMSRKPISIVKSVLHGRCDEVIGKPKNWCNWKPFDQSDWTDKLGRLEYAYLLAYAISMFASGQLAERINLRIYLGIGMIASGALTVAFGMGYILTIHAYPYYILIQILTGVVQATGWPAVVTIMGNWFGKGKRGLIMGIWNSHTSFGNMVGSVIAGVFVSTNWGLSFIIPGTLVAGIGVLVLALMVPYPEDIGLSSPDDANKLLIELKPNVETDNYLSSEPPSQLVLNSSSGVKPLLPYHNRQNDRPISVWEALRLPNVAAYSIALFFAKLVAYTFLYWLPNYLNRVGRGLSPKQAGNLSTLFDMGGIVGGVMAGYGSDLWMTRLRAASDKKSGHHRHSTTRGRAGTCAIMLSLAAPTMFYYQYIAASHSYFSFVTLFVCGLLVNGPYALITTAVSADLGTQCSKSNSRALATVTAIIDGTGSLGAALGPFLTGLIVPSGWANVFYMLILADLMALLAVLYIITGGDAKNTSNNNSHSSVLSDPISPQRSWFSSHVSLTGPSILKMSTAIIGVAVLFCCGLFFLTTTNIKGISSSSDNTHVYST